MNNRFGLRDQYEGTWSDYIRLAGVEEELVLQQRKRKIEGAARIARIGHRYLNLLELIRKKFVSRNEWIVPMMKPYVGLIR